MKRSIRLARRSQLAFAVCVFLCALMLSMSGCAQNAVYMGDSAYVTVEECRIARRLNKISDEDLFECSVNLPETLF